MTAPRTNRVDASLILLDSTSESAARSPWKVEPTYLSAAVGVTLAPMGADVVATVFSS